MATDTKSSLPKIAPAPANLHVQIAPAMAISNRLSLSLDRCNSETPNHIHNKTIHSPSCLSPIPLAKSLSLSAIPDQPITIRTSKKWVLPPRPKPGRKPSVIKREKKRRKDVPKAAKAAKAPKAPKAPKVPKVPKVPKSAKSTKPVKPGKDEQSQLALPSPPSTSPYIELDSSIIDNPIKQEILRINEENYFLKLEVIRLVSDLKSMRKKAHTGKHHHQHQHVHHSDSVLSPISPISQPPSRKRLHDEDINDLIVSLVDLNPTDQLVDTSKTMVTTSPLVSPNSNHNVSSPIQVPASKSNEHLLGKNRALLPSESRNLLQSDEFLNLDGQEPTAFLLQGSPTVLSEDDDLTSTISTTPSTMLTSIKTNDTLDSLSGTTIASNNSPTFKLLDIPEIDLGTKIGKEAFSIFNGPASLVDDAIFGSTGERAEGDVDNEENGNENNSNSDNSNDFYEFDGTNDVEMEFENFINGNDLEIT